MITTELIENLASDGSQSHRVLWSSCISIWRCHLFQIKCLTTNEKYNLIPHKNSNLTVKKLTIFRKKIASADMAS